MLDTYYNESFKNDIIDKFNRCSTVNQFASLLNYINAQLKKNDKEIITKNISSRHLYYLAKSKDNRYYYFTIPKKNGNKREINSPDIYLKNIQKLINILLQIVFENNAHYCTNGFLINRNITRNAIPHINKRYVLNLDIENFFPSISFRRIKSVLSYNPFNLTNDREEIGFIISNICTQKGILPQGAPTSPILSIIATQKLDRNVSKKCIQNKIKYTRYADDLTFSSNRKIFNDDFIDNITKIIEKENFNVNKSKTTLKNSNERQEVTGIIVNKKLNINRKFLKKVRTILHNWEKSGINYTQQIFQKDYKTHRDCPDFRNVLSGYIGFIGIVRGKSDKMYNQFLQKYNFLKNQIDYSFIVIDRVREKLIKDKLSIRNNN